MDDQNGQPGRILALPRTPDAIELRHLRAFVAVAEELNFGRAAARLYLSQPALSRQIRSLERLIGCDLLRRSTHRVELTLAGEALLDRARRLVVDVDDAISATRSVGGELAGRIARLWEPVSDLSSPDADLRDLRTAVEDLHSRFPMPEVAERPVNAGGVPSLLLGDPPATILFLHGGGYVMGSAFGYRPFAGTLAAAAEAGVLIPDYRLAPEHPFPAAVEDAMRAYLWMIDGGMPSEEVAFAGDSSGAGLVLSLLITLKQRELPLPGRAMLFCPWADLTCGRHTPPADESPKPVVTPEQLRGFAAAYLAGHPENDPVVSPLTADLTGLPPLLIQAATGDGLLPDASLLADHARDSGVDARLELYPVATHDFHLFWSFLPEAADAVRQAGRFITRTVAPPAARSS